MSLKDQTNALFYAADSRNTTPEKMKSIIVELKSDKEFFGTGAFLTALQGALHIAAMPGNDDESGRRSGVIKAIADAVAEDCGKDYVRGVLETRKNPESLIVKILGE